MSLQYMEDGNALIVIINKNKAGSFIDLTIAEIMTVAPSKPLTGGTSALHTSEQG